MRTARLATEHGLETRHTFFPLHPDTPADGLTLEELFGGRQDIEASQARMRELMAGEGLDYGNRTHTYNSRKAQELAKWAEVQPGGEGIHEAMYRAYFVRGLNLAQDEVVLGVARELGLPGDEAELALGASEYSEAVDRDWERSRAIGISGVPTFVIGQHGVVGAQPYDVLERLVREARGGENRDGTGLLADPL